MGRTTVFVPGVAPGDRVLVRVLRPGAAWSRADQVELLVPGPARRAPPCPQSDRCGGCHWQQVTDEHQRSAKEAILARALRQAGLPVRPEPLVPSPRTLGYRCRARLCWQSDASRPRLGFRARRSHRVVDVRACPVLLPRLSALLPALRDQVPTLPDEGELLLLGSPAGACAAELRLAPGSATLAEDLWRGLQGHLTGLALRTGSQVFTHGRPTLDLSRQGEPFYGHPGLFAQANPWADREVRRLLSEWLADRRGPVLELFSGSGNLTRDLCALGEVTAVETSPEAVALARQNLAGRPVRHLTAPAGQALTGLLGEGYRPTVVVLDPPRTGARDVVDALARLGAPQILYVSCDPMTLARDAKLIIGHGYRLLRLRPVDTLPQTFHFETLADFRHPDGERT